MHLKSFISLLLLLAFTVQTFNNIFIVADYYVNTVAYAKNCENRTIPQLHCNGKCQMMKMLKQEQKKEQQNPERKLESKNEIFVHQISNQNIALTENQTLKAFTFMSDAKAIDVSISIFHPPTAA